MQTGRFITKLVGDRERFYQTNDAEKLLNEKNIQATWNLSAQEPGEYPNKFPDDLAITNTIISVVYDSTGREIHENDTVIVKLDDSDRDTILEAVSKNLNLFTIMHKLQQNNGVELKNPLPEVQIPNG